MIQPVKCPKMGIAKMQLKWGETRSPPKLGKRNIQLMADVRQSSSIRNVISLHGDSSLNPVFQPVPMHMWVSRTGGREIQELSPYKPPAQRANSHAAILTTEH